MAATMLALPVLVRVLEDRLDSEHASQEVLQAWARQEQSAFSARLAGGEPVSDPLRHAALRLVACLNSIAGLPGDQLQGWLIRVAQVIDMSTILVDEVPPERTFSRVAAVWMLTLKFEAGGGIILTPDVLDLMAESTTRSSSAYGGASTTLQDIQREEIALCRSYLPGVSMPSVVDWLATIFLRFGVAADRATEGCFDKMHARGTSWAMNLLWVWPASKQHTPQSTAVGIFGAVLISAGVVLRETVFGAGGAGAVHLDGLSTTAFWNRPVEPLSSTNLHASPEVALGMEFASQEEVVSAMEFATLSELDTILARVAAVAQWLP